MKNIKLILVVAAMIFTGCAVSSDPTATGDSTEAAKKCVQTEMCIKGDVWSKSKCKCIPAGVSCGSKHCASDEYCCSESCGICERMGAMCPAIACK